MKVLNIHKLLGLYQEKCTELTKFIELRKKAFSVDSDAAGKGLNNILNQQDNWNKICTWNATIHLDVNWDKIYNAFQLVKEANISKKEFRSILEPTKDVILKYEKQLTVEINEIVAEIDEYYNDFVKKTGGFSFIFENNQVKELIINNLLLAEPKEP